MAPAPIAFGRYRLYEKLAAGGMAELFFATANEDPLSGGCVIKRVLPHLSSDAHFLEMFLDEARLAAQLDHPGIARIYDLGREGDHYFMALEYLAGEDCGELIAAAHGQGQPLDAGAACTIAARAAEALHYAHERRGPDGSSLGLVHRDVSPSNLFVTYEGDVKLLDFGIARSKYRISQTRGGFVKGKTGYMPPEQRDGLGVDRRSDVWALGVCLYELLTAQHFFDGGPSGRVAPPSAHRPGLSPKLDPVVLKAVAHEPGKRYATAAELAVALAPLLPASPREALARQMRVLFGAGRHHAAVATAAVHPGTEPLGIDRALAPAEAVTLPSVDAWKVDDVSEGATERAEPSPVERKPRR